MINKRKTKRIPIKVLYKVLLCVLCLSIIFLKPKINIGNIFLYETLPFYKFSNITKNIFNKNDYIADKEEYQKIEILPEDKNNLTDVIGIDKIIYQHESDNSTIDKNIQKENLTIDNLEKMRDIQFLKNKFYTVDARTDMLEKDFNIDEFLSKDMSISKDLTEPRILIMHTHPAEMFVDSADISEGIISAGNALARTLEERYGIKSIHNTVRHDRVNGKPELLGSYERMEPIIRQVLKENPSIEMIIDLHRDGVDDSVKLVKNIDGKQTASIMFFNGLTKIINDGKLENIDYLQNEYLDTNLALSFQMQLMANKMYPELTRRIYLNAYRYSLHMLPKSMLIEVGAQTNTKQEIYNAMDKLANVLAGVILSN